MKNLLKFVLIVVSALFLTNCEYHSDRRANVPLEKVVRWPNE